MHEVKRDWGQIYAVKTASGLECHAKVTMLDESTKEETVARISSLVHFVNYMVSNGADLANYVEPGFVT